MGEARRRGTFEERKVAAVKRDLEKVLKVKADIAKSGFPPKRYLTKRAIALLATAEAMGIYTVIKKDVKL